MNVSKQDLVTLFVGDKDESNSNDPVIRAFTTAMFTVVDYTQLAGVEINIDGEQIIEALDWTAEISNTDTAFNLAAVLNAQLLDASVVQDGDVVTVIKAAGLGTVTSSDMTNLPVVLS